MLNYGIASSIKDQQLFHSMIPPRALKRNLDAVEPVLEIHDCSRTPTTGVKRESVPTIVTPHNVVATLSRYPIISGTAMEGVCIGATIKLVPTVAAIEQIRAITAI